MEAILRVGGCFPWAEGGGPRGREVLGVCREGGGRARGNEDVKRCVCCLRELCKLSVRGRERVENWGFVGLGSGGSGATTT